MVGRLVVVCGLTAEAKIARGPDQVEVVAGGGDAGRILAELDARAPSAVLSFGIAGGLRPGLAAGDVRVADAIIAPAGRRIGTDEGWSRRLAEALDAQSAIFAGVERAVTRPQDKAALHAATGATLVDMESHIVADWAARNRARFAALRVVTDAADRALPHAAAVGMRPDGGIDLPAILKSLAKDPSQLAALIRTGLDARAAFAALLRCRQRLGPRFALLDL